MFFPIMTIGSINGPKIYRVTESLFRDSEHFDYLVTRTPGVCSNGASCRTYGRNTLPESENDFSGERQGILVQRTYHARREVGSGVYEICFFYACRKCAGVYRKEWQPIIERFLSGEVNSRVASVLQKAGIVLEPKRPRIEDYVDALLAEFEDRTPKVDRPASKEARGLLDEIDLLLEGL